MAELERELAAALMIARAAGDEVLRMRGGELGVEMKPGDEPVTLADKHANELIVNALASRFPGELIISEEAPPEALAPERMWLVDPIDGTKDFIRGADGFSVMIGLVIAGRPVLGVVHQPAVPRTFYASPDGAFVDGTPLAVSPIASAAEARLVASASHRTPDIDRVKQTLGIADEQNVGSVGVKLCLIALGARDLYVNPTAKTKAWDTCAPEAILARAGGRLTDLFGNPVDYTRELRQVRGLVGSNGHVHDEVVGKLAPLFAFMKDRRADTP
jgi:3'(2'), 5'-bisphosphate nucleotidase